MGDALVIDTYQGEGPHDWTKLPDSVAGVVLKVSEGIRYWRDQWLQVQLQALRAIRAKRPLLIGGYHYMDLRSPDGERQALFHLDHALEAGLYSHDDDFAPMLDLEWESGVTTDGKRAAEMAEQFAATVKLHLGVAPILYANGAELAERGISGQLGCAWFVPARYTEHLPATTKAGDGYQDRGWTIDRIPWWQYAGDGAGELESYPYTLPVGRCDISVAISPIGAGTIDSLRRACVVRQRA